MKTGPDNTWADRLVRVTRGQNEAPHEHLMGSAPNDVKTNKNLQFALIKDSAETIQHNTQVVKAREERLKKEGAYRVQEKPRKFERSFQPRYGGEVHTLHKIEHGVAVDTQGKLTTLSSHYQSREVPNP